MMATNLAYLIATKEKVKSGQGRIFEIIVPFMSSTFYNDEIEFRKKDRLLYFGENRKRPYHLVEYRGNAYYILQDFYRFPGDKGNRYDVDQHYRLYKHGLMRFGESGRFAYHYRELKEWREE